ncbi:phage tail sheath subtilisin-like domain-containing protein [Komagataeibacter sp. FNDCR1]|nr:phage tail sheath subtilisin-like domain-containing protein [Komagataeibacter sp. FNDCR1]
MADSTLINGSATYTPGVFSSTSDTAMNPVSAGTGNILCVMGISTGGKPNTLLGPFATPAAAADVLVGGELLTAVQKCFSVSDQVDAPSTIYAVNVGSAPAGTLTLKDSDGNVAINLVTDQYGTVANTAQIAVYAGTVQGSEISVGYAGQQAITQDNIARGAFGIAYTGTGTAPTITVASESVTLSDGTTTTVLDLNQYQSIAQLVDAINTVSGFEATIVATAVNQTALNSLDPVTAKALTSTPYAVTANLQAQIDFLNSTAGGGIFTATRATTATGPAAPAGWQSPAPVTVPAPLVTDWTNALTMLQSTDVNWLAILSPNPAVWAAVDAHVQYMSKTAQRERRAWVGPDVGMSLSDAAALGVQLNSDRVSIAWPGFYGYDANGNETLYPPYMAAALIASGFAGLSPGQTMTNVALDVIGPEVAVNIPTDTDVLIPAGITPIAQGRSGTTIVVRAISSWLNDNYYDRVEVSTGAAADFTNQQVRNAVQARLGSDAAQGAGVSPITMNGCISDAETALNYCATPRPLGPGVIVGDSSSPAWDALTAVASGDTVEITFNSQPVIPLNFIKTNNALRPYTGTVTVNVSSTGSASGGTTSS